MSQDTYKIFRYDLKALRVLWNEVFRFVHCPYTIVEEYYNRWAATFNHSHDVKVYILSVITLHVDQR